MEIWQNIEGNWLRILWDITMVLFEDTIYSSGVYIIYFIYINITVLIFVSLPGTIPVFIGIFSKSLLDAKFCVSFRVSYGEIFLKSTPDILYFAC